MKKHRMKGFLVILLITALSMTVAHGPLVAQSPEPDRQIVFIDESVCSVCARVHDHGVITGLEAQGVEVIVYDIHLGGEDLTNAAKYAQAYGFDLTVPVIIAGDDVFIGADDIIVAYDEGDIYAQAQYPLRSIEDIVLEDLPFFEGLWLVTIGGLLSGFNPCAIAMLLMFISMIGFIRESKIIIIVSAAYIAAVFVTHFAIVYGFLALLGLSRTLFGNVSIYLYAFFGLLTLFLAVLTFYDFLMARSDKYENVKNQLPGFIRKFNEKIMIRFTTAIDTDATRRRRVLWLVGIPVLIGILVGITEAACTAQPMLIAFARLEGSMTPGVGTIKLVYLLVSNVMFIMPLVIIAIVAIKSKSTMALANFIRSHLSKIKLATALFFFIMSIYFVRSVLTNLNVIVAILPL